ncbi:hypothetical protein SADUNF_Sadunf01G0144600 [Salix dunnii]|uniref:Uncharacterized protein n=1 Tax=Salix dunnii TaxID=1413687 RepID=A0A835TMU7_9ROSI|nr:hypothetical protein SADUNF_Sadunf01G0144600 [Salix dunnii]
MDSSRGNDITHSAGELVGQAQTGEQVKNMAQGAAEAVKNTLGMSTENTTPTENTSSLNRPINPSNPSTRI